MVRAFSGVTGSSEIDSVLKTINETFHEALAEKNSTYFKLQESQLSFFLFLRVPIFL